MSKLTKIPSFEGYDEYVTVKGLCDVMTALDKLCEERRTAGLCEMRCTMCHCGIAKERTKNAAKRMHELESLAVAFRQVSFWFIKNTD